MSKWMYKILKQEKLHKLLEEYKGALIIEITHLSKPGYHIKLNTHNGLTTLGRLSKRQQFKNLNPVQMDEQPAFINKSWWKIPDSLG